MTETPVTDRIAQRTDVIAELLASIDLEIRGGLDTVQALRMIRETAEGALTYAVAQARHEGESWEALGRALGTSRQGAWEKYGAGAENALEARLRPPSNGTSALTGRDYFDAYHGNPR